MIERLAIVVYGLATISGLLLVVPTTIGYLSNGIGWAITVVLLFFGFAAMLFGWLFRYILTGR